MLQHLGHRAQVSSLLRGQLAPRRHLDDVEGIWCDDGRVHVAVIQEVPHNLKRQNQTTQWVEMIMIKKCDIFFMLYEPFQDEKHKLH